jgi:hypothetical protein
MPPPASMNDQFAAMSMNANPSAENNSDADKAQSAIDDIFADIKPATDAGAQQNNIDSA